MELRKVLQVVIFLPFSMASRNETDVEISSPRTRTETELENEPKTMLLYNMESDFPKFEREYNLTCTSKYTCSTNVYSNPQLQFDAVLYPTNTTKPRNDHHLHNQKQINVFYSMDATATIPENLDKFFNLTITYRLDSDIPWPFFAFIDRATHQQVAPAIEPVWRKTRRPMPGSFEEKEITDLVKHKEYDAVFVASTCNTQSRREDFVRHLRKHGVQVDTHGQCGQFQCPHTDEDCAETIGQKYYFYLVLEKALCVDYLTEKVVLAMESGAVPVILSGANLTRFLPPGSYIDALQFSVKSLADEMARLIADPSSYERFFWWRTQYRVERRDRPHREIDESHPFCKLCSVLHKLDKHYVYTSRGSRSVRKWWNKMPNSDRSACVHNDESVYKPTMTKWRTLV